LNPGGPVALIPPAVSLLRFHNLIVEINSNLNKFKSHK